MTTFKVISGFSIKYKGVYQFRLVRYEQFDLRLERREHNKEFFGGFKDLRVPADSKLALEWMQECGIQIVEGVIK